MTDNSDKNNDTEPGETPKGEVVTQINAFYDEREDRITLRATSNLDREFKLWITLRIFRLLNKTFDEMDEKSTPSHIPEDSRKAVQEFRKEQTLKKANFTKSYSNEHLESVFGEKPLLVDKIKIQLKNEGNVIILTFCGDNKECAIPLTKEALIPTRHLLERAAIRGEWIKPPQNEDSDTGEPVISGGSEKIIH